jgi:4-amino-4-deoxy-L-arabinose transferase-like glycosyltransferase
VNPLLGGLGVVLVFFLARGLYGPRTAIYAVVLSATSAWVLFMSASYMNHVGAMTLALLSWALIWGPRRSRPVHLVAAGTALAAAAATRPLDAVAAAVPIACWFLITPSQRRPLALIRSAALLAIGTLPVVLGWGYFNWRVLGNPLTVGYSALYGPSVNMGVHSRDRPQQHGGRHPAASHLPL